MARQELLVCIDGTHHRIGAMAAAEYDATFATSHVRRIADASHFGPERTLYIRGPNMLGSNVDMLFHAALDFIERRATDGGVMSLNFCGYSRGGAIALDLANAFARPAGDLPKWYNITNKDTKLVNAFQRVRRKVADGSDVASLVLFDAVDMALEIDAAPVAAEIRSVAHVVRSKSWGSRNGWGNAGVKAAGGSRAGFPPRRIDGTHAALGGLPTKGDLPKPLVRALLKLPAGSIDWQDAERIYRGMVPCKTKLAACVGKPGLFLDARMRVLVDAGAHAVLTEALAVDAAGNTWLQRQLPGPLKANKLEETLRADLRRYLDDAGGLHGLGHGLLAKKLTLSGAQHAGAFESIGAYFARSKAASLLIERYREADRKASRLALATVRRLLADRFPAAL